jgi:hypothetical protein
VFRHACHMGLEGIVSKRHVVLLKGPRLGSRYRMSPDLRLSIRPGAAAPRAVLEAPLRPTLSSFEDFLQIP